MCIIKLIYFTLFSYDLGTKLWIHYGHFTFSAVIFSKSDLLRLRIATCQKKNSSKSDRNRSHFPLWCHCFLFFVFAPFNKPYNKEQTGYCNYHPATGIRVG